MLPGMMLQGESGVVRPAPDSPQSAWTRRQRIHTNQYSGSAWGSQLPEGAMFVPCWFAFLVWDAVRGTVCAGSRGRQGARHASDWAALLKLHRLPKSVGVRSPLCCYMTDRPRDEETRKPSAAPSHERVPTPPVVADGRHTSCPPSPPQLAQGSEARANLF